MWIAYLCGPCTLSFCQDGISGGGGSCSHDLPPRSGTAPMTTLLMELLVFLRTDALLVFSIMAKSSLAASRLPRVTSGSRLMTSRFVLYTLFNWFSFGLILSDHCNLICRNYRLKIRVRNNSIWLEERMNFVPQKNWRLHLIASVTNLVVSCTHCWNHPAYCWVSPTDWHSVRRKTLVCQWAPEELVW